MNKPIKLLGILTLFLSVLFIGQLVAISTETSGDVDGEFKSKGFNNPVEINAFRMFLIEESPTAVESGESLQPQSVYRFELDVFDFDSVNDIEILEFRLIYTLSGSSIDIAFDDATTTGNNGQTLVLRFVNDAEQGGAFYLVSNAAVSWSLESFVVPTVTSTQTAFTFSVDFEISKVASMSEDLEWSVGIKIVDGFAAEGADPRPITYAGIALGNEPLDGISTFNMNWYGEINVPSETRVSWPVLLPGSGFDSPNNSATLPAITYIANGGFAREVNSDLNWIVTQSGVENVPNAILNTDESVVIETTQTPQTFSLKINEADDQYDTNPSEAEFILTSFRSTATSNVQTTEDGVAVPYEVFIALSRNFQNATYQGKLTFLITNLMEVGA